MSVAAPHVGSDPGGSVSSKPSVFVLDPGLPRFAFVLLCYVLGLAGLATLSPFDFDFQHPHGYLWETTVSDIALNLAFLFPAGFLLRLARAERAWPFGLDALCLGLAVSVILELSQLFLPTRVSSPSDVLSNALGAWAGGLAHSRIGPYLDRRLQRQLSLHLPLANLLYLSVPLLFLDGLATSRWAACVVQLPLAAFIAVIAAGLYKHRLEGTDAPFPNVFSFAIGLVSGIGYMSIVVRSFAVWLAFVTMMVGLTRLVIAFGTRLPASERRFVQVTIQRAAPWYLLYVVLLGCQALLARVSGLDVEMGPGVIAGGQVRALVLLRDVTAFTLLGYLGSELRARSSEATVRILGRVMLLAVPAALLFGGLRAQATGWQLFGTIGLLCLGALAGGFIHRAQLRLVRSWSRTTQRPVVG